MTAWIAQKISDNLHEIRFARQKVGWVKKIEDGTFRGSLQHDGRVIAVRNYHSYNNAFYALTNSAIYHEYEKQYGKFLPEGCPFREVSPDLLAESEIARMNDITGVMVQAINRHVGQQVVRVTRPRRRRR